MSRENEQRESAIRLIGGVPWIVGMVWETEASAWREAAMPLSALRMVMADEDDQGYTRLFLDGDQFAASDGMSLTVEDFLSDVARATAQSEEE